MFCIKQANKSFMCYVLHRRQTVQQSIGPLLVSPPHCLSSSLSLLLTVSPPHCLLLAVSPPHCLSSLSLLLPVSPPLLLTVSSSLSLLLPSSLSLLLCLLLSSSLPPGHKSSLWDFYFEVREVLRRGTGGNRSSEKHGTGPPWWTTGAQPYTKEPASKRPSLGSQRRPVT